MGDIVLLGKLVMALGCVLGTVLALRWGGYHRWSDGAFVRRALGAQLLTRLGLYLVAFVVLKLGAQSDVLVYYDYSKKVLDGVVPGRDPAVVPMHYGPLFLYITAGMLKLWDSAKALVLLLLLMETAAMPLWIHSGRRLMPERAVRDATVLYLLCPLSLINVSMVGLNNTGLVLLLGLSTYLALRARDGAHALGSGAALGLSVIAIKFLSLLQMPILLITSRRPVLWGVACAGVIALGYGGFYLLGVDPLKSLHFHAVEHGSSGNLPYVLGLIGIDTGAPDHRTIANLIGLAGLGVFFLSPVLARRRWYDPQDLPAMFAGVMFVMMLVSKKSFPHYLMIALYPLCLVVAQAGLPRLLLGTFLALGVATSLESSLWFRWMNTGEMSLLTSTDLPAGVTRAGVVVFAGVEFTLLALYGYFVSDAWRRLALRRSPPAS